MLMKIAQAALMGLGIYGTYQMAMERGDPFRLEIGILIGLILAAAFTGFVVMSEDLLRWLQRRFLSRREALAQEKRGDAPSISASSSKLLDPPNTVRPR